MARPAFDRLSFLDSTFLIAESTDQPHARRGHRHVRGGSAPVRRWRHRHRAHPRLRRVAAACHPAVPPGAGLHADRGPPGVGGRPALQHRVPRAPYGAAAARRRAAAEAPLGPRHVAAARPLEAAVGDVGRRGARGRRPLRHHHEDPPLHGRRHVERRPARGAAHARVRRTPSSPRRAGFRARCRRRGSCCAPRRSAAPRCRSRPCRRSASRSGARRIHGPISGRCCARCATRCGPACARCRTRRSTSRSARTAASTGWR